MRGHVMRSLVFIAVTVMSIASAQAQTAQAPAKEPTKEALAAARDLVVTSQFADKFKALLPTIMKGMKPAMVQGRPEVEKDYDALVPQLLSGMQERVGELQEAVTLIYAANFTVDEMQKVTAFFKSPAGQSYLAKSVTISEQAMAAGQQFGKQVGAEAQKKMADELRKKGHAI